VDVRLIVATHRDLEAMVKAQTFRQDLWYRLNVAVIRIPPLRDRPEDIELLATRFLSERLVASRDSKIGGFSESALDALKHYEWPGNVRQLRAAVERASIVATGTRIELVDLPPEIATQTRAVSTHADLSALTWNQALEEGQKEVARRYLEEVLSKYDGRVAEAAAHAGIERESFYRLLRRFGVELDGPRTRRGSHGED
jgi:two-component system response regulator HydG